MFDPEFKRPKRRPSVCKQQVLDISVLMKMVLDKNHISQDMHFKVLSERFSEVVGELLLPHVSLVKLDKSTLVLKAASSAWQMELTLQKKAIIDKCNLILGQPFVRNIRFEQNGKISRLKQHG